MSDIRDAVTRLQGLRRNAALLLESMAANDRAIAAGLDGLADLNDVTWDGDWVRAEYVFTNRDADVMALVVLADGEHPELWVDTPTKRMSTRFSNEGDATAALEALWTLVTVHGWRP